MSYQAIVGAEPSEQIIAGLTQQLGAGEVPLVGALSSRFEFRSNTIRLATLLVTNRRLLVAKDKLFGKPKPAVDVELSQLASTGFGPLYGVGPTWEVHFRTARKEPGIMYFGGPVEAEAFKKALHNAAIDAVDGGAVTRQSNKSSQSDVAFQARLTRLHDLVDALRPMAGQNCLGRPFGEGYGLEEALQAVFSCLESPEDVRRCDEIMTVELVANTKDDQVVQEMLAAMGATPGATQQYQLSAEARKAVESLGGAAQVFIGQFEGPGSMWDLWNQRDDVAAELLCWHTIARLRMATAGRMPPVVRP